MLRRDDAPARLDRGADPLGSITVVFLALIGVALFIAAILAVYTYSTPGVEVPMVVAISIAFAAVLAFNVLGHALRRLRPGR